MATSASASVDNSFDLAVADETSTLATGATQTLTATITPACNEAPGCEIDFEVESGAALTVSNDDGANPRSTDTDNSPQTPDMTCTVANAATDCIVQFTSATAGSNTIRSWVDDDKDNSTLDFDASEGQDEATTPGARTEVDDTEVTTSSWFGALVTNFALDCTPETQTLPSSGAGSQAAITCKAFNDNGAGGGVADNEIQDGTEAGIAGVLIDGENLNGANDPDNGNTTPADYNNFCTTGADGTCSGTVSASESQAGNNTEVCFWADADNDAVSAGTDAADGNDCGEAAGAVDSDETDKVLVTWIAPGTAFDIACSPRSDQNLIGTSHTVDCHVEDPFGNPSVGALVDFDVTGKNGTAGADNSATDTNGNVSFTYTDDNTAPTPEGEEDSIFAEIDGAGPNDMVFKYWFTTLPVVDTVILDMNGGCAGTTDADATDTEEVENSHFSCGTVLDGAVVVPGAEVNLTLSGPGEFIDPVSGDPVGQSLTVTTDSSGQYDVEVESFETGTSMVTATSNGVSDSGTIVWTVDDADSRFIQCTPDDGTAEPGSSAIVECLVTDSNDNPVPAVDVDFTEAGPGRADSDIDDVQTDAEGIAELVVSTTSDEEGVQTITGTIDEAPSECDDLVNSPDMGDVAGDCDDPATIDWGGTGPDPTTHARSLSLKKLRHVRDGGKRKLFVRGSLRADDGFAGCEQGQEVKLQRKVAGSWFTQKTDTTGTGGNAKYLVRDRNSKYRLRAVQSTDGTDTCGRATSNVRRHKHKKGGGGGAKFVR